MNEKDAAARRAGLGKRSAGRTGTAAFRGTALDCRLDYFTTRPVA
ncbi:hypothetical protein BACCAP_02293 [Pseudoflavonifractor capillosus ATCC 29799]|uniref:Uncharacterized protein n=1 Tax=Pseudoflavonifractor capillosus ATCC 29799 TaxID=411467 RepID=A6NVQ0_9FIRM|nr:hypothetical protein BACCAP_02293 [Pseudoflavonifractor capillosus ATCC 29799]